MVKSKKSTKSLHPALYFMAKSREDWTNVATSIFIFILFYLFYFYIYRVECGNFNILIFGPHGIFWKLKLWLGCAGKLMPKIWIWTSKIIPDLWFSAVFCLIKKIKITPLYCIRCHSLSKVCSLNNALTRLACLTIFVFTWRKIWKS